LVGYDDTELVGLHELQGDLAAAGRKNVVSLIFQLSLEQIVDELLVVNDQ